ncbi:MAG: hypothetical protein C0596_13620 [Marinilabiliales bacterium]|nr:MAG: hypothetical protein C0596_13620 [Marinilabiliales bacterium]
MKRLIIYIFILASSAIVFSCKGENQDESQTETNENLLEISKEQFDHEKMKIGQVENVEFENEITANGKIVSTVGGITHVSSKADGIVEQIYVKPGDYVKKYKLLLSVSSNDLIVLQQNLAETYILVEKLKYDYDRVEKLYQQNIASEKEFRAISSEYNSSKVKYNSLKMQLQRLGLNTDKIENGEFYTHVPVYSPIEGVITDVDVVIGEYIEPQHKLFELIDASKLQIEIDVYEKDMESLAVGNKVLFSSVANGDNRMSATLTSIGISVNNESNTVKSYAKPDSLQSLINNSNVEVYIQTKKHTVKALPTAALVKSEGNYYVFTLEKQAEDKYYLKQVLVETGSVYENYTEVLSDIESDKILIDGVYNLIIQ